MLQDCGSGEFCKQSFQQMPKGVLVVSFRKFECLFKKFKSVVGLNEFPLLGGENDGVVDLLKEGFIQLQRVCAFFYRGLLLLHQRFLFLLIALNAVNADPTDEQVGTHRNGSGQ